MNQNAVKVETASAVTFLERETLAKLHHAFYGQEPVFYATHAHRAEACLGAITSGGTLANLTALWCARNAALGTVPARATCAAGVETRGR
jgi:glutamate decarboxylase